MLRYQWFLCNFSPTFFDLSLSIHSNMFLRYRVFLFVWVFFASLILVLLGSFENQWYREL